jgi:hypothetical protein
MKHRGKLAEITVGFEDAMICLGIRCNSTGTVRPSCRIHISASEHAAIWNYPHKMYRYHVDKRASVEAICYPYRATTEELSPFIDLHSVTHSCNVLLQIK